MHEQKECSGLQQDLQKFKNSKIGESGFESLKSCAENRELIYSDFHSLWDDKQLL